MAKFTKRQAMAIVGKVALEKAGCGMRKRDDGFYSVYLPMDGRQIPAIGGFYTEETAWEVAAVELLTNSQACADVLVSSFRTHVLFEYRKIDLYPYSLWSAFEPIYSPQGGNIIGRANGAVSKSLPVAIALWFTYRRGVQFDPEVLRALEAEE